MFEKGNVDISLPTNYRPISFLSQFSKTLKNCCTIVFTLILISLFCLATSSLVLDKIHPLLMQLVLFMIAYNMAALFSPFFLDASKAFDFRCLYEYIYIILCDVMTLKKANSIPHLLPCIFILRVIYFECCLC